MKNYKRFLISIASLGFVQLSCFAQIQPGAETACLFTHENINNGDCEESQVDYGAGAAHEKSPLYWAFTSGDVDSVISLINEDNIEEALEEMLADLKDANWEDIFALFNQGNPVIDVMFEIRKRYDHRDPSVESISVFVVSRLTSFTDEVIREVHKLRVRSSRWCGPRWFGGAKTCHCAWRCYDFDATSGRATKTGYCSIQDWQKALRYSRATENRSPLYWAFNSGEIDFRILDQ